jgi:copper resistance protein B
MRKQGRQLAAIAAASIALAVGFPGTVPAADWDHAHMDDDPVIGMVLLDEFEWQNASPDDALAWNVSGWLGRDTGRLLFRSEGDLSDGDVEELRAELLWSKPIAAWWDLVGGLRQDAGPGPGRSYGLIGLQGLAPYRVHVEADLYAGERGQVGARFESAYKLLLTNRLILVPRAELQAFGKDDAATRTGSGLSQLELGLRLRYEIRRELAPYVGVEWTGHYGDTADFAREDREAVRDARFVAGIRVWF